MPTKKKPEESGIRLSFDSPLISSRMDQLIGYHARRVQIILMQQFERMAGPQMSPALFHLLLIIDENPGVSMSAIAAQHGIDRASIAPAVQRLQAQGLIERCPSRDDKRVLMLRCTEAGHAEARSMSGKAHAMEAGLLGPLSAQEQKTMLSLLKRVARRRDRD